MMNKSKIDWCDFTFNPVTGCKHGCEYCYAAKQIKRFSGDVRLNKSSYQLKKDKNGLYILDKPFKNPVSGKVIPDPVGFEPIMHKYRLAMPAQKKKPAKIFVCSMADLFGDWIPDEWIAKVFEACNEAPWHTYMFLTKNPRRYMDLAEKGIIRAKDNFWYGSTIINQSDYEARVLELIYLSQKHNIFNTFFSLEPLQGEISMGLMPPWIIIGAETGNRKNKLLPQREWIENIVFSCVNEVVFMKKNLMNIWKEDLIQEWPNGMPIDKRNEIPRCKNCKHHTAIQEGKRGERHECKIGWESTGHEAVGFRHVIGKDARTSPLWCPVRKEEGVITLERTY